jgi:hypothetical protein
MTGTPVQAEVAMPETLRDMQLEAWRLKLLHGFDTTSVPLNFCFTHSEVRELAGALHEAVDRGFRAWRNGGAVPSEFADVLIFWLGLATMLGFDMQDAVQAKLAVIAARSYRPLPNGMLAKDGPDA